MHYINTLTSLYRELRKKQASGCALRTQLQSAGSGEIKSWWSRAELGGAHNGPSSKEPAEKWGKYINGSIAKKQLLRTRQKALREHFYSIFQIPGPGAPSCIYLINYEFPGRPKDVSWSTVIPQGMAGLKLSFINSSD